MIEVRVSSVILSVRESLRSSGRPDWKKGETAEGFFVPYKRDPGLGQKMRQTVTVVERYLRYEDPVKNKCHECVPMMGDDSWHFLYSYIKNVLPVIQT